MSPQDREHITAVINFFWGDIARPEQVTSHIVLLTYEALSRAGSCTAVMHLVPRAPGIKPGTTYVLKQLRGVAKRIAEDDERIYQLCRQRIQINYMSEMRMALMGL